jgi:hypothetical protein
MALRNLLYHNVRMDVEASNDRIQVIVKDPPAEPIRIMLEEGWQRDAGEKADMPFSLSSPGTHQFSRSR